MLIVTFAIDSIQENTILYKNICAFYENAHEKEVSTVHGYKFVKSKI